MQDLLFSHAPPPPVSPKKKSIVRVPAVRKQKQKEPSQLRAISPTNSYAVESCFFLLKRYQRNQDMLLEKNKTMATHDLRPSSSVASK